MWSIAKGEHGPGRHILQPTVLDILEGKRPRNSGPFSFMGWVI